jgi:hypothetical protein
VREGSPALQLGFQNFPMDQFGVQWPKLKNIARTPELPRLDAAQPANRGGEILFAAGHCRAVPLLSVAEQDRCKWQPRPGAVNTEKLRFGRAVGKHAIEREEHARAGRCRTVPRIILELRRLDRDVVDDQVCRNLERAA